MTSGGTAAKRLIRSVAWAQDLLAVVLSPGDLAVDLTAGNGLDTLFLWSRVAPHGQVVAFDVQLAAIAATGARCHGHTKIHQYSLPCSLHSLPAGIHLVHGGHEALAGTLLSPPRAILANLGYLPGGERSVVTRTATTFMALEAASRILAPGGRLAVVAYPGHAEGRDETVMVEDFFSKLEVSEWLVLRLTVCNRRDVPLVLVGEKRRRGGG